MSEVTESLRWEGRLLKVTWREAPFLPLRELVTQASGMCFTPAGQIVLVSSDGLNWALPGGHPEPGETVEKAFSREVWEEACSKTIHIAYLGAQEVADPESPIPPRFHYQARFWAQVDLGPFKPRFETRLRRLVEPESLVAALNWDTIAIAEAILAATVAVESRLGASRLR